MPGGTGNDPENSEIRIAAIGRCFVDALNEGLTRSVASGAYALPGQPSGTAELSDPYAAAVLRRFTACLPAALAREDRHDAAARSAAVRRARRLLAEAFGLATPAQPWIPSDPDSEPPLRDEAAVSALLMECAVLVVLEQRTFKDSRRRPAELLRVLGRSVRESSLSGEPA
ncbi:hypothetical protein [Streptomyces sp. NPDC006551]|uniref:hypothetical protein n=1 Tax=Streptomyces sp. NPDC006551 TaxID=3157178 RepID=UPI0033A9A0C8